MLHTRRSKGTNGWWWWMGERGPAMTDRRLVAVFSPDGKRVAYGRKQGGKWLVVVDGKPGPAYDGIGRGTLIFSPDSKHVAYGAQQGDKWLVVVDGKPGPTYDGIPNGSPVFSPDSQHVAYGAQQGDKCARGGGWQARPGL